MEHLELVVLGLLVATAALAVLANAVKVPYPIVLVVGGSVIGLVSGGSGVSLDPDIVLLIFLPPLLYGAAFFTSLRDLRRHVRSIALLSIGVVFVTMIAVALVAHHVIGLGWAESFVLGAIVSPTDAVAPAEILRRLGAPRRLITIVEGENLTNDWTALVLYRFAVAAVVTGSFSLAEAGLRFVVNGVGGRQASLQMAQAALARIEELRGEDWTRDDTLERVRGLFEYRRRRFDPEHETDRDGTPYEERTDAYRRLMFELFDAQREALIALRNEGVISDEVRRRLERDLDLEETRIQA